MAIRKRRWLAPDGSEQYAWQVDYRDQAGKRRSRQFRRKKDAEAWHTQAVHEVANGVHTTDRDSITVVQAAEKRIARAITRSLEHATVRNYKTIHRLHIVPFLGSLRLSQLTRPRVEKFRDELAVDRSSAMVRKAIRELATIIGEAESRGEVAQNVAARLKVENNKRHQRQVIIPTRDELRSMIRAAEGFLRPLIMLAVTTGLRSSELRGLNWPSLDLQAATITVSQRAEERGKMGPPKSAAGHRTIPLAPEVVSALKAWKVEAKDNPAQLVFPSSTGTPFLHSNLISRHFAPLQVRAGICRNAVSRSKTRKLDGHGQPILTGKYGLHALRHAAASNWIANRIDLKRLQTWLGHASIQQTIDKYGHLIADTERDAELAKMASRHLFE